LGMVKGVVSFQAKLNARPSFLEGDILEQAHVPVLEAGTAETVVARIQAYAAFLRGRETRGVDERIDVPVAARLVGVAGEDDARRHVLAARDPAIQRGRTNARYAIG